MIVIMTAPSEAPRMMTMGKDTEKRIIRGPPSSLFLFPEAHVTRERMETCY